MSAVNNGDLIDYTALKKQPPNPIIQKVKDLPIEQIQRTLAVVAIACAFISLFPHYGLAGSVSLRSISCATAALEMINSVNKQEAAPLQIMQLASAALGLAGVAANINPLVTASIATEIIFQTEETIQGATEKDLYKTLSHLGFVVIDSFTLAASIIGGWPYMTTAAALNSLAMITLACKAIADGFENEDPNVAFDVVYYLALTAIEIASSVRVAKLITKIPSSYRYNYTNHTGKTVVFYDRKEHVIAAAAPGESISFNMDPKKTNHRRVIRRTFDSNRVETRYQHPSHTTWVDKIIQQPMTKETFPTLPVGSSAFPVNDKETKCVEIPASEEKPSVESDALQPFLHPQFSPMQPCFAMSPKRPSITVIHEPSKESFQMDYEFAQNALKLLIFASNQVSLEGIDLETFKRIKQFLSSGKPGKLDVLSERKLMTLFETAEYLQISNLGSFCIQEIAKRLANSKWKDTELLEAHREIDSRLTPLVCLFNFQPRGSGNDS